MGDTARGTPPETFSACTRPRAEPRARSATPPSRPTYVVVAWAPGVLAQDRGRYVPLPGTDSVDVPVVVGDMTLNHHATHIRELCHLARRSEGALSTMAVLKTRRLEGHHAATTALRAGMCDDRTDDELIAKIAAGESAAFETLYHRHAAIVYRTVLRVVQDRALAEDLVQEVFWRVWRRSTSFTGKPGQVMAWLRTVA